MNNIIAPVRRNRVGKRMPHARLDTMRLCRELEAGIAFFWEKRGGQSHAGEFAFGKRKKHA
jgi:hypothetical protein